MLILFGKGGGWQGERRCVRRDAGGRGMKWRLEVGDGRKSSMLDE